MCVECEDSSSVMFLFQGGDSRFDGRERVKYTREQLLELKEVIYLIF